MSLRPSKRIKDSNPAGFQVSASHPQEDESIHQTQAHLLKTNPFKYPLFLFALLFCVRCISARFNYISDCDESMNYWEPTHMLLQLNKENLPQWLAPIQNDEQSQTPLDNTNDQTVTTPPAPEDCNSEPLPECNTECQTLMQETILAKRKIASWNRYYANVVQFVKERGLDVPGTVFVEVGIAFGGLSAAIITSMPNIHFHAVDPFMAGYDPRDAQSTFYVNLANGDPAKLSNLLYQGLAHDLKSLAVCRNRVTVHHRRSTDAAARFQRHSVDIAFIDGLHTRAGVNDDVEAWIHVMKPGGFMVFNDYGATFQGVKDAVDDFSRSVGVPVQYLDQNENVYIQLPMTPLWEVNLIRG